MADLRDNVQGQDIDRLLSAATAGDQAAATRLLGAYRSRLRRLIGLRFDQRLVARIDPSDVVQDALAEGARRLEDYLPRQEIPFYPWLRRIALDELAQVHRRHVGAQRRTVAREELLPAQLDDHSTLILANRFVSPDTTPSEAAMRNEIQQRVRKALDLLSPQDREIIILRHLEELTFPEAAAALRISLTATQSRYRRAAVKLHELLREHRE